MALAEQNAPSPANLSANTTYAGLTSNRSSAAASYTTLRTKTTDIGNYAYSCDATAGACLNPLVGPLGALTQSVSDDGSLRIVSGSGYLGAVQQTMSNISLLALRRAGATGTFTVTNGMLQVNTSMIIANDIDTTATAGGTQNVQGTFTVAGGNATIGSISTPVNLLLGNHVTSGNPGLATATVNLTGGTLTVFGDIKDGNLGAGTINSTLSLNGATLDMKGNSIGTTRQSRPAPAGAARGWPRAAWPPLAPSALAPGPPLRSNKATSSPKALNSVLRPLQV